MMDWCKIFLNNIHKFFVQTPNLFDSFLISLLASIFAIVLTLLIERSRLPYLEIKPEEERGYRNYPDRGRWKYLRVVVLNKRMPLVLKWSGIPRQTAENCRATLEFFNSDTKSVAVMRGRWVSTPEIPHIARDQVIERVLYPDPVSILVGEKEILDVVVQQENDPTAYGWNNEAYLNNWKTPQYRLPEGDYKVKINITTQNGISFSKLLNLEISKNLELTILVPPNQQKERKMSKSLIMLGLILSLIATIFLFLGSKHLPWNMQTLGGTTATEIAFYNARQGETIIGFVLLFLGFLSQLIGVIKQK